MDILANDMYTKSWEQTIKGIIGFDRLRGKSILITGASGLIGSFLVDVLMYANEKDDLQLQIYALGRCEDRLKSRFFVWKDDAFLHFVEHDIKEPLELNISVDYVIHAAGNAFPAAFQNDPIGTIDGGIIGTKNILDYAYGHSVKHFLYLSSGEVYGQMQADESGFREEQQGYVNPLVVRSCYPLSKRMGENLCMAYRQKYDGHIVIARLCHTYGAGFTEADNRATAQFLSKAVMGERIVLKSKGEQIRSYLYIADCVSAILTVLLNGESGKAYNVADSGCRISIADFAKTVADIVSSEVVFEESDCVENPMKYAVLDTTELEALGWRGQYSIDEGIRESITILRDILEKRGKRV